MTNLVEIDYNLTRFIRNTNQEQLDNFYNVCTPILDQVYKNLKGDCENVQETRACLSILVNCIYLDIDINIEIIPQILELYNNVSYQPTIDILLQNLLVDKHYNHILLEQPSIYQAISIYIYRGLNKLLTCISSNNTIEIQDDVMATLLDFVYIYMLNNSFNEKTKDTFHDCLFVLVNSAYCNYIQPEFIPMTVQLYKTSYYSETRYLILNYLYNVHHDTLYKKYLMWNIFITLVQDFVNENKYPKFCKILENEFISGSTVNNK